MNYFDARQDSVTKKWHYTVRNGRYIDAVGYCAEDEGHETSSAACDCYRKYLIENASLTGEMLVKLPCQYRGCVEMTKGVARVGQRPYILCDEHRNEEGLEAVVPEVGSSIES